MDMEKNRDDLAIVESTIRLAHNLALKVVAEGVETAQVLQHLTRLECDLAQGYHLGRPMPATEVDAFVQQSGLWIAMPSAGVAQGGDRFA